MEYVINPIIITLLGAALIWVAVKAGELATKLHMEESRSRLLFLHLTETQAALQTALGGGWQLADPNKDVFLLPEVAILDFSDTLTGGKRDQYQRSSKVRIFLDPDLYERVVNATCSGIPISFRGLEWKIIEFGQNRVGTEFSYIGGPQSECILELVTYAAKKAG